MFIQVQTIMGVILLGKFLKGILLAGVCKNIKILIVDEAGGSCLFIKTC